MDKIEKLEKAVFTITSYDSNQNKITSRSGFFISADGIAIAPSNIFLHPDSIAVTLRNGKNYKVDRIISVHKMANLAMFKVTGQRQKGFDYIIPSQNTERNKNEVLVFSHPKETREGISLGVTANVFQAPYLDRIVEVQSDFGPQSSGAPVINDDGKLIGIAHFLEKNKIRHFLSTHILNDTLWVNFRDAQDWKKAAKEIYCTILQEHMYKGITNFAFDNWVEAAKNFSFQINNDTTSLAPFVLRGEARRRYENFMGMRTDFDHVNKRNSKHFLLHYFEAINHLKHKENNKAFLSLITSIEQHQNFSPALIEFGLLAIKLRHDLETAQKCFDQAIKSTPLFADGYYERSRLTIQYLKNPEAAMKDISKAIELNHKLPGAYSIRGTLRIQIENYLEAISDLDKAIEIDPNDTHALFNRGLAYYNLGMKQQCCKDWDKAGQLGHYKSIKYQSRYCNKTPIKRGGSR